MGAAGVPGCGKGLSDRYDIDGWLRAASAATRRRPSPSVPENAQGFIPSAGAPGRSRSSYRVRTDQPESCSVRQVQAVPAFASQPRRNRTAPTQPTGMCVSGETSQRARRAGHTTTRPIPLHTCSIRPDTAPPARASRRERVGLSACTARGTKHAPSSSS